MEYWEHLLFRTYDVDSLALGRVMRLNNPHVDLFLGAQAVEVRVKVSKLIRKDVRVGQDVEVLLAETFLHLNNVFTQAVFTRELIRHREVVYFLEFTHGLVEERF